MSSSAFRVCILVTLAAGILGADKESSAGGVTTRVKGQSGKIAVFSTEGNDTSGVTITYDSIKEIDTDGNAITGGQKKHSFNNFAQLDFTFGDITNTTFVDSNVSVATFKFEADVNEAKLTSYVFIFLEDGNITAGGENITVEEGDMKFNAEIKNWPFCGSVDTCTKGQATLTGEYLDFYIEIKGQGKATKNASAESDNEYSLGGGAKVVVPKQVTYDNTTTEDMPAGYPMLVEQGGKQKFVFRFRKFDTSALYDPVVKGVKVDSGSDDGGDNGDDGDNGGEEPADNEVKSDLVEVKVKGRSGKLDVMPVGQKKASFTVEFDNLKEVQFSGAAVNVPGHSLTTFAKTDFNFASPTDATVSGLSTRAIQFSASLSSGAMVKVFLYVFKEAGNVTNDDENISVKKGTVKFNIEVSNWTFCESTSTDCKSLVGEFLDFEIVIKGEKEAKNVNQTGTDGDVYDVGSGTVTLSKKVKVDGAGSSVDMAPEYPKMVTQGSKQIFQFRFPKFTDKIEYDPVLATKPSLLVTSGSEQKRASVCILIAAILFQVFQRLW